MLNRKIENQLLEWKNSKNKMPLVIKGVRQCGKTYIVQKFAKEHYRHVIYLNFAKNPTLSTAFENSLDVDDIIINLTTLVKGAVFENLIADIFNKMERKLYYYHKDSGLEIDFVMRYKGKCTLLEVNASTGNAKSAKTILAHPEKYHINSVIKLGKYNIGREGSVLTLPLYMAFLLRQV